MTRNHMDPSKRSNYIYRAYDAEGDLLYVGCTVNLKRRWREHSSYGDWAHLAVRFKVSGPYSYAAAREMERRAIICEAPAFNRTSPARKAAEAAHRADYDNAFYAALAVGTPMQEAFVVARAAASVLPADNRKLVTV